MKEKTGGTKSIKTPYLKVTGNCLEIENTAIQLSNISLFSTTDVEQEKFPIYSILLILAGIVFFTILVPIAIVLIVFGVAWIILWYSKSEETKKLKRLTIITNSGNVFPIVFSNEAFMKQVVEVMTDIIRDPSHDRDIVVNIQQCTLHDSSHIA